MNKARLLGVMVILILGFPRYSRAQGDSSAGAKLEAIFKSAEIPYVKLKDDRYKAVVSISDSESDQFQVYLQTIGNNPNDEQLQVMQMVFFLGAIPEGRTAPTPLLKQINEWNADLTRGSVFIAGSVILYQSSAWLSKTDQNTLINDALVGHFTSQELRKKIEPYLKQ